MTLQHRACFPCLAETLLWEQAVWRSGTACPASPWDFSVAPLGTAHLPGSWFTQHPAYGSYIYQGPLFSSQVQWSHITLPQGALGDSFPSEGFTSEDRTALKKTREDPLLFPLVKQLQSSKVCHRSCQKGHEWALLLCQHGPLCRAQLIRENQTKASECTAISDMYRVHCNDLTLLSCHPTVWKNKDFEKPKHPFMHLISY